MTAAVFDYAAIASRMNCDKPQKKAEIEEAPKKAGQLVLNKKSLRVSNDDDEDDD